MKNKIFVILAIVILSLFMIGCNETMVEEPTTVEEVPDPEVMEELPVTSEEPETKESQEEAPKEEKIITITGENYKFMVDGEENPEIKVKVGQNIKIEFTSTEGFHDLIEDTQFSLLRWSFFRHVNTLQCILDIQIAAGLSTTAIDRKWVTNNCLSNKTVDDGAKDFIIVKNSL